MISFRSKITKKLLNYFFLNPQERQYATALARLIHEDPKNVYSKLIELENEGLFISEYSGRQRYFSLSSRYPMLKEVKKLFFASAGFEQEFSRLLKSVQGVESAYLFGSYISNKMTAESDIDILVIGNHSELALQKKINDLQRNLAREINIVSMSPREFIQKKKQMHPFIQNIFSKKIKKIV